MTVGRGNANAGLVCQRCASAREEPTTAPMMRQSPGLSRTAVPYSRAIKYSREEPGRSIDINQTRTQVGRAIRPFGRLMQDGGESRRLVDHETPFADGTRPVIPGALFTPPMVCVAAWRGSCPLSRTSRGVGSTGGLPWADAPLRRLAPGHPGRSFHALLSTHLSFSFFSPSSLLSVNTKRPPCNKPGALLTSNV